MSDVMLRRGDWVVVCDGAKALVFENRGALNAPKLKLREASEQPNPPTHELGTDSPGRTMNSADGRPSAVGQTDWHDEAERGFLADLTRRLDSAVTAGEVTSLVMVAPPRALGMIRSAYTPALRAAVRTEIDKDFVKLPVPEIERHLSA
jgi:protein required for attachment to host cells